MKLYIIESNYVTEAIDDIKKYYPNIPDDVFMQLIALDPTYRGNDSAGKYGKWLLNLYNKGRLSQDEFNEVPDLLNQFTTYRNRIANKDLNSYKSLDDLSNVLASVIDDDSMLTDRQKVRFLKNVKAGKVKVSAEDDYDIVLDTPKFVVYVPNTHEASMKLGVGTKWCTAHENPEWYNHYTENGGKLYIIKDKKTGDRWQYSDSTNDFLDEYDDKFDIPTLMQQDEKLSKFFKKFLGVDYYNFDGIWVYNGGEIPEQLKPDITKIIVDENVTKIGRDAFGNCKNLTSINIPNSVTKIGRNAFWKCNSLTAINIPNSVTKIGDWTFSGCTSLTSLNIPDSVTEIGESAFSGCSSLTSINIPNGVIEIGEHTFSGCTNLTFINIPNSVIEIEEGAFSFCKSLISINIPNSVTEMGYDIFYYCNKLTVYTNNEYVIDYCNKNDIPTKPLNNNESINKNKRYKLHIKES